MGILKAIFLVFYFISIIFGSYTILPISAQLIAREKDSVYSDNFPYNSSDVQESRIVSTPTPIPTTTISNKVSRDINKKNLALKVAAAFLGIPYLLGGTSKLGMDCSAFTQHYFSNLGIKLPRTVSEQINYRKLLPVNLNHLRPMDLLFFSRQGRKGKKIIHHVGIYLGDGKMIHASIISNQIEIVEFWNAEHWRKHFFKALRPPILFD